MLDKLMTLVVPFSQIALQLKRIADMYELDLASCNPPVIVQTEKPSKHDTQVTYGEEDEGKLSLRERLVRQLEEEAEDDDAQPDN